MTRVLLSKEFPDTGEGDSLMLQITGEDDIHDAVEFAAKHNLFILLYPDEPNGEN